MVQFHLPKNSKVEKGKTHNKPVGKKFNIYRFDPEKNQNPKRKPPKYSAKILI